MRNKRRRRKKRGLSFEQDVFQEWEEVDPILHHHYLQHKVWSSSEWLYQWMVASCWFLVVEVVIQDIHMDWSFQRMLRMMMMMMVVVVVKDAD